MAHVLDAFRSADPAAYDEALRALTHALRQQQAQHRCDELFERAHHASPSLAAELREDPTDEAWRTRLRRWPQAWARSCAATWLAARREPGREQRLEDELAAATKDLARLTGRLAAARSWRACLTRMSAAQVQALQSYKNNMANVGKGTGKYAERFREAARDAMRVAQDAVPAWVMPIQQVLASVPPRANAFDVVIVDEASQAELTSAFLLWLAPRVIVVGDDKQCTPSEVASGALQPVFDRIDTELHDIPVYLRNGFTPRDSIFSLLRSRFGQVIRLREHFRCMPEIITWCSNEFYRDAPLVPLRQFGADRLPPLRTRYVPDAVAEGKSSRMANVAEAEAIAQTLAACLADSAYDGKSFGVVVLQGQSQVDILNSEIKKVVGPEEWERRRVRVGTPPDFQGDERHVVFLSMVVAPGDNSPMALTKRTFEQRFNVAVSRAQDQLWLFHSVTADLLRPGDLRRSLLDYMTSSEGERVDQVLQDVTRDRRHDSFDSLFEQRVYLDLISRGYHVTPQVETNGRYIDLVVTGAAGKLAVECDGDAFHTTPEQRLADLHREQELKRCGWTFQRIRQSEYELNRERALQPVWTALDALGIGPLGEYADGTWTPRAGTDDEPPIIDVPARETDTVDPYIADGADDQDIESVVVASPPEVTPQETMSPEVAPTTVAARHDPLRGAEEPSRPEPVVPPVRDTRVPAGPVLLAERPSAERRAPERHEPQPLDDLEDDDFVLALARRGPLSSARVAEVLAIGQVEARSLLGRLVEQGRLVRTGQTRGTRYVLPEWAGTGGQPRRYVIGPDQRQQILRAAQRKRLTNESTRHLLRIDRREAFEALSALVDEGELVRRGHGRGTYYVIPGRGL